MKRITDFIIEKRYFILVSFILFSILSFFMMQQVKINYDIASYLPKTSETRTGLDIMDEEFDELSSSSFNLMFKGLEELEKKDIYQELAKIDGVKSIDYDNTSKYNKDDYTMYVINVDAKEDSIAAKNVFNKVKENYQDYEIYTNGAIASRNTDVLPVWIVFLAIGCAMIILIIMCESYIEPFLFIFSIGMAVFLNKGTNIIFGSVSNITDSIVAILQLALSMDYSIMLMNRYSQEKNTDKNKVSAMKKALYNSFISISSSSITTIVGLLALVFMSFTIGRDLGLVLAKGVLFSLISIFFVLPGLILMFDKWIVKTKKKTLNIKLNKLGNISYKLRYPSLVIIVLALVGSYLLKGNLTILYTNSEADKVADIFPNNNQMAIIYKNEDEDLIANHCKHLEKEDRVVDALCYGNTINDRLTYDKLNNKFEGLGSDVSVDDYLLKIVYYNYYNKDNNSKMTLSDLITFIKSYIYPNSDMNKHVTTDTRKNIERLNNFVVDENINKKRTSKEIANILGIDEGSINDLFIYYNSLYNDNKLTIKEFVDFMNKDILTNKKYAKNIDENTKNSLKTLTKFTNANIITKQMTSNEMAKLFGVDKQIMADLYSYYLIKNPMSTKLSLNEFANFVVNDVLTDQTLSKTIDNDARENIKLLAKFSDKRIINQKMNSASLSELFNLDKETVDKLMLLYYSQIDDGTTFTLKEFIIEVIKLKLNTDYLDDIDINLEKLEVFMQNKDIFNNDKVSKDTLKKYFDEYLVNKTYSELKIADDIQMTPEEFIDKVLDYLANYVDAETMERLQLIKRAIIDNTQLTSTELSKILNVDAKYIYQLYALINYNNGNTSHFQMTPYELVDLLINNSNKVDSTTLEKLYFVKKIMDSSLDNKIYSSKELASFLDMNQETVNSIYALYNAKDNNIKLSPKIVTSFILKYQDDSLLKHNLSNNMLAKVKLVDEVMSSTLNNKKYSSLELSQLLGVDKETLDLIYSLYNSKDKVIKVSLKEFTDFLLDKVLTNKKYSSRFDNTKKVKLQTINKIMNNSLVNYQYGFRELYDILTKLSDSLDSNLIELVYLYYGSEYNYNNNWTLTIETFVNYLNSDIIVDTRFIDFIDDDMKDNIKDAKETVGDAKKLLVGKNYSRIVLNTDLELESKETFDFLQNIKDRLSTDTDTYYVVGDSPMAYEMSKTFNSELDFITLLTMVFIFVVVAITFKSILIPFILIMIIQCAVYMTMGILSLIGGNVYFISLLIVQSILMGATIDYAILYTSYYVESRKSLSVKEAVINSYNKSIHTILTSSSILIIVTLIVGNFTSAIASKICKTLSQGTLCSALLILLILPAILAACDKLIIKKHQKKI